MSGEEDLISVSQFCEHWWTEIAKKARRAVVFIDDPSAECLHWNGGIQRLLQAGAEDIKELNSFESGNEDQKKALFLVGVPVVHLAADIVGEIIKASSFEYVQIVSTASPTVHNWARFPGREVGERHTIEELETQVLQWMGNLNYTCEIFTLPFGFACLAKDLFVMPCSARLFPLLDSDAKKAKDMFSLLEKNPTPAALKSVNLIGSSQEDLTYDILPHELQVATQQFVTCLHQMFQMMSVKEDVFTVGSFSRVLGQQLDQLPQAKHRRKTALNKASVILIDRTLDLSTPSKTSFKTILDKIKAMLPEFPGHRNDVQIEMGPLFGMKSDSAETETFCGGCLANSFHLKKTEATASWLDKFVMADEENKVVKDLHTELCEALQITPNKKKVTTSHLERDILGFKDDYEVIKANLDTIQRASALVQAGKNSEKTREFEQLAQLQAHFRQEIGDEKAVQGYLAKMVKLVRGRKEKQLDLESVLLLLVNIYSLLPPGLEFFPEDEDRLQSVISEAIVQEKDDLGQILQSMTKGMKVDEILAHQMVKKIFLKLNAISRARDKLQSYQDLTEEDDGFLKRVMSDVFADDRRTVADLEHQSQGLGSMLKSGIGFFGVNMTKMHPRENPTLFIFVVGGLTAREVKEMKDLISSRSKCKVVVGSTKLTSPADCLRSLFVENPLLTD